MSAIHQVKTSRRLERLRPRTISDFYRICFPRGRIRITTPIGKRFLVLGSLWLASQCVTDIVRHTAFADYARGWSNIGITLVNFAVIWTLLYGRPRRLELYGWGLVVGSLLTISLNPSEFTLGVPWKFGFAYPLTLGVFLLASHEKWRSRWPIAMIAMVGVINIGHGEPQHRRSLFGGGPVSSRR